VLDRGTFDKRGYVGRDEPWCTTYISSLPSSCNDEDDLYDDRPI
jgi:hypothetical protein